MSSTLTSDVSYQTEKPIIEQLPVFAKSSEPQGPLSRATTTSSVEKGYGWEGYQDEDLPDKTQGHILRNIRHQIFSLYRRLFGIVFATNMAILIALFVKGSKGNRVTSEHLAKIVIGNLFTAILMREEHIINLWFIVFTAVPLSWPLFIRRFAARVHHIGGIHSGCAVSGTAWLIAFAVVSTLEMVNKTVPGATVRTVGVTYGILALLIAMLIMAYPALRVRFHDSFEHVHRFAGWTVTALFWCLVLFLTDDYRAPGQALGHAIVRSVPFWLLLILTFSIASSWFRLKKVEMRAEVLSNHAVRYHFNYAPAYPGQTVRLSTSPLTEWHSFACVGTPETRKNNEFSTVLSRAGDWTSAQIAEPPKKIWVRGVPTYGALTVSSLFRRVVFVATGSGIGPIAPWLFEGKVPHRLLWTAPNVRATFGDKLVDDVLKASPDAVIYDTRTHGKPDMVKLVHHLVKETDAEAVCIISNQKLTEKVVYGMMSRGIPAIGAIWDS